MSLELAGQFVGCQLVACGPPQSLWLVQPASMIREGLAPQNILCQGSSKHDFLKKQAFFTIYFCLVVV